MSTLSKFVLVVAMCGLVAGCGRQNAHRNPQQVQPGNAATTTQPMERPLHLRRICAADIQKFCAGDARPRPCLRAHLSEVSDACKTVMQEARARHRERMLRRTQDQNPQGLVTPNKPQQNQTAPQNPPAPTPQNTTPHNNNDGDD